VKNDTIGFFGPVGWARLVPERDGVSVTPGAALLAHRSVHFEQWGIDAIAKLATQDARFEPWMVPRRLPFLEIHGTEVVSAVTGKTELTLEHVALLEACDGIRSARQLAEAFAAEGGTSLGDEEEVLDALRLLRDKQFVAWTFEGPLLWNPEQSLARRLGAIEEPALREEALGPLRELEAGRERIVRAAGDAEALAVALQDLESTFTRLTGAAATRHAGSMYAGRQLVFEDCRRDIDVTIGNQVLERIGPALSLLLKSSRWLTFEVGKVYRKALRELYTEAKARSTTGSVRFSEVWFRAQRMFFGAKERPVDAVIAEARRRWAALLAIPEDARRVHFESEKLRPYIDDAFSAPRQGWTCAKYASPDIMLEATSAEAISRGDFTAVLGEMHIAANTMTAAFFCAQHPQQNELKSAFIADLPGVGVSPVHSKDWPKVTVRFSDVIDSGNSYVMESSFDASSWPRDRVLALSDLIIEDGDPEPTIRLPNGAVVELLEFFAEPLCGAVLDFKILERRAHTPRISIDGLVIARETWSLSAKEMAFAYERDEAARFLGARRWARAAGIPRYFFAKSAIEVKPMFVDLDSPVYLGMFCRLVRAAKEHVAGETALVIAEMLPDLEHLWLTDASGERYTSELRFVVVDDER
jgi:hypothetical protein